MNIQQSLSSIIDHFNNKKKLDSNLIQFDLQKIVDVVNQVFFNYIIEVHKKKQIIYINYDIIINDRITIQVIDNYCMVSGYKNKTRKFLNTEELTIYLSEIKKYINYEFYKDLLIDNNFKNLYSNDKLNPYSITYLKNCKRSIIKYIFYYCEYHKEYNDMIYYVCKNNRKYLDEICDVKNHLDSVTIYKLELLKQKLC